MKKVTKFFLISMSIYTIFFAVYYFIMLDFPDMHILKWEPRERFVLLFFISFLEFFIAIIVFTGSKPHTHNYVIPHTVNFEGKEYHFKKCDYPGCNLCDPID
jgi:hypothetical protein